MFCSGFSHCRGREYSIIFTDSKVHKTVQSLFPWLVLVALWIDTTNKESNMSAHVLLNLFNKLRKRDKMRG